VLEVATSLAILLAAADGRIVTALREVEVLKADAILVVQGTKVGFLDLDSNEGIRTVFTLFDGRRGHIAEIARAPHDAGVFVHNGRTIFSITQDAKTATVARLDSLSGDVAAARESKMNWFFRASPDGALYVSLIGRQGSFVGALDIQRQSLSTIQAWPPGIDVDTARRLVYIPRVLDGRFVDVASFADGTRRRIPVSEQYHSSSLSPDRTRLVLSGSTLDNLDVAILDLETQRETRLPFRGSKAVWWNDRKIFFNLRDTELWSFTLGEKQPRPLLVVPREKSIDSTTPAIISTSGRLVAWSWRGGVPGAQDGTIVIDLDQREYRKIDEHWPNIQLLENEPGPRPSRAPPR
jgi:hypothetical protein